MSRLNRSSTKAQYLANAAEALKLADIVSLETDKARLRRSAEYWSRRAEGLAAVDPGATAGERPRN